MLLIDVSYLACCIHDLHNIFYTQKKKRQGPIQKDITMIVIATLSSILDALCKGVFNSWIIAVDKVILAELNDQ